MTTVAPLNVDIGVARGAFRSRDGIANIDRRGTVAEVPVGQRSAEKKKDTDRAHALVSCLSIARAVKQHLFAHTMPRLRGHFAISAPGKNHIDAFHRVSIFLT